MENKNIYGFRKSKKYGLCSALLATMAFISIATADASAQEAKPGENQPAITQEVKKPIEVPIDNSPVEKAAADISKSVETTKEDKVVDKGVATTPEELKAKEQEIKEDQDKQVSDLKEKAKGYEDKKSEYDNKLVPEYNDKKAKHDAEVDKYEKDKAKYDKALSDYNSAKTVYDKDKAKYDADKVKYEADKNEQAKKQKEYEADKAEKQKEIDSVNTQNEAIKARNKAKVDAYNNAIKTGDQKWQAGQSNPETVSGPMNGKYTKPDNWTNLKSTTINGLKVVAEGTVKSKESFTNGDYNVFVTGNGVDSSKIITGIAWGDTAPTADNSSNLIRSNDIVDPVYGRIYNPNNASRIYKVKAGTWVTIPDAVKLHNGQKKDLMVRLTKPENNTGNDWLYMWNDNGAVNYLNSIEAQAADGLPKSILAEYKIAGDNSNYLWTNIISDTDVSQKITKYDNTAVLSVGGGLRYDGGDTVESDPMLGAEGPNGYGRGAKNQALDGLNDAPKGTAVYMTYGSVYARKISNTPGFKGVFGIADLDFGAPMRVSIPINPSPEPLLPVPELPKAPTPPKLVEPKAPVAPTPPVKDFTPPGEPPKKPEAPIKPKATYHDYKLLYLPKVVTEKKGKNSEGVDINNKPVLSGETIHYELTWDLSEYKGMKASKEDIAKGFYHIDDFPEEAVTPDVSKVKVKTADGQSANEDVNINVYKSIAELPKLIKDAFEKTNYKPKGSFLLTSAKDPEKFFNKYVATGKDLTIDAPMTVKESMKNSDKVFKNDAAQIEFDNKSVSEVVVNNVPKVTPHKDNLNEKGQDIDNKQVSVGSTNYYKLTWDLDQYKGIQSNKDQIAKGFFFVDDFPEEALNIDNSKTTIKDSKGNVVKGVSVKSYNSLSEAPELLQKAIKDSKINIKNAFQAFIADNPTEFYNKYVVKGESLTITTPMTVKPEMGKKDGEYKNVAYQLDFGMGYETEIRTNKIKVPKPDKKNENLKGVNINNKNVLPGSTNVYKLLWDLDQYKGIHADSKTIAKGFYMFDDYPEEALDPIEGAIKLTDSNNKAVQGVSHKIYKDLKEAPKEIQDLLAKSGIKGAFQVFSADNAEEFFNKYVFTGNSITITNPMKVKEELAKTGGKYQNKAIQSEFGQVHETDVVENSVPKLDPKKDVSIEINGKSIDNGTIQLGQVFNYHLIGSHLPENRSDALFEYKFIDDYQETHDEYNGVYKVYAQTDIKLSDGTIIKKGTDITDKTKQSIDSTKGSVTIELKEEFLNTVVNKSEFQADVFLQMTRISAGEVLNKYTNVVNGVELVSNTVKTTTPTPPPSTPGPKLPDTGETSSALNLIAGSLSLGLAVLALKKKKIKLED